MRPCGAVTRHERQRRELYVPNCQLMEDLWDAITNMTNHVKMSFPLQSTL